MVLQWSHPSDTAMRFSREHVQMSCPSCTSNAVIGVTNIGHPKPSLDFHAESLESPALCRLSASLRSTSGMFGSASPGTRRTPPPPDSVRGSHRISTARGALNLQHDEVEEDVHLPFPIPDEVTASPGPSTTNSLLYSYPIALNASSSSSDIVRLNIGGAMYMTTRATLLSRGSNFFGPLLDGHFGSLQDASGAYFVDRNGRLFSPLLDYLRQGTLALPTDVKMEILYEEAKYYAIDLLPGLCGDLKEGLYTSSNWILFFERDPDHPWIIGITGVEEKTKRVFFQEPCFVKDGQIHWRDYLIYVKHGKMYIWTKSVFKSKTQLYYRTPKSERFPQLLAEGLVSERRGSQATAAAAAPSNSTATGAETDLGGVQLMFSQTSQGISCRSCYINASDNPKHAPFFSKVIVLCKSLLIMVVSDEQWLLYLHSDLAFFAFNHPFMEFSDSFHLLSHK